jgi:hypothetical protein
MNKVIDITYNGDNRTLFVDYKRVVSSGNNSELDLAAIVAKSMVYKQEDYITLSAVTAVSNSANTLLAVNVKDDKCKILQTISIPLKLGENGRCSEILEKLVRAVGFELNARIDSSDEEVIIHYSDIEIILGWGYNRLIEIGRKDIDCKSVSDLTFDELVGIANIMRWNYESVPPEFQAGEKQFFNDSYDDMCMDICSKWVVR